MTNPRSSHHAVYCAWPGRQVRMSRTSAPDSSRSASGPVMRYLYSGEVSKTPTALRTAKYSCFGAWVYRSADSRPCQCV